MATFTWPITLCDISMANNQNECMSVLYMRAMNTTTALTWHTITVAVTVADYHFSIHSYKACNWIIKKSTRFHTVASHVPFSNVLFVYLILHKTCSLSYSYTFHFIHTHLCLQILYTHAPISSIHQHTHKLQSHPHTHTHAHTGSNLTHIHRLPSHPSTCTQTHTLISSIHKCAQNGLTATRAWCSWLGRCPHVPQSCPPTSRPPWVCVSTLQSHHLKQYLTLLTLTPHSAHLKQHLTLLTLSNIWHCSP